MMAWGKHRMLRPLHIRRRGLDPSRVKRWIQQHCGGTSALELPVPCPGGAPSALRWPRRDSEGELAAGCELLVPTGKPRPGESLSGPSSGGSDSDSASSWPTPSRSSCPDASKWVPPVSSHTQCRPYRVAFTGPHCFAVALQVEAPLGVIACAWSPIIVLPMTPTATVMQQAHAMFKLGLSRRQWGRTPPVGVATLSTMGRLCGRFGEAISKSPPSHGHPAQTSLAATGRRSAGPLCIRLQELGALSNGCSPGRVQAASASLGL
jgi:hypothetical protein